MKHCLEILLLVYPEDVFVFKVLSAVVGGGIVSAAVLRGVVGALGNFDNLGHVGGNLDGLTGVLLDRRSRDFAKKTHVEGWFRIVVNNDKEVQEISGNARSPRSPSRGEGRMSTM